MTQPREAALEREKDKHVPAWVDKARLMLETCHSERGIDLWVQQEVIPPGRMRGGKLMWKWSEVDACLDRGATEGQSIEEQVRQRTRDMMGRRA